MAGFDGVNRVAFEVAIGRAFEVGGSVSSGFRALVGELVDGIVITDTFVITIFTVLVIHVLAPRTEVLSLNKR